MATAAPDVSVAIRVTGTGAAAGTSPAPRPVAIEMVSSGLANAPPIGGGGYQGAFIEVFEQPDRTESSWRETSYWSDAGFKWFTAAAIVITGIGLVRRIREGFHRKVRFVAQ